MEDSFWDIETSGQTTSKGGRGRTTAEMQNVWMYIAAGWDFVDEAVNGAEGIWKMCCDEPAYPRLAWEQAHVDDSVCPEGVDCAEQDCPAQH